MTTEFSEQFEKYIDSIDRKICDYVKESDEFGRHRNGLVQKENSISILKTQGWTTDVSEHISVLQKLIKEEFDATESQRVSVDDQLADLKSIEVSLEDSMRKLLNLHRKIKSTCLYTPFQDGISIFNSGTESGPAAVDDNPTYAPFDNQDAMVDSKQRPASVDDFKKVQTAEGPSKTFKFDPFNTETGVFASIDDTVSKVVSEHVPMTDLRQSTFDIKQFAEEDNDLKKILEEIREQNSKEIGKSTFDAPRGEDKGFLSKWLR